MRLTPSKRTKRAFPDGLWCAYPTYITRHERGGVFHSSIHNVAHNFTNTTGFPLIRSLYGTITLARLMYMRVAGLLSWFTFL